MFLGKFFFFMLFACNVFMANAQDLASSVAFQLEMPESNGTVDNDHRVETEHYTILVNKVKSAYKNNASFSNQSPFAVVPRIEVVNDRNAGEMQRVRVVTVEIYLTVQDRENGLSFGEFNKSFIATGDNTKLAISKAVNQLKSNDPRLKSFFSEANTNIIKFYKENCPKILKSAETNIKRKEFSRAFNMLKYIPEDLDCFREVENLITEIYRNNKEESCRKLLQKAQVEAAKENYGKALRFLIYVDPTTSCYQDVSSLIGEIGKKVNEDSLKEFEMEKLVFEKMTDLQKMEILVSEADILNVTVVDK